MTKSRTFFYYYADEGETKPTIRIKGKRQPGPNTIPWHGTWTVQEIFEGKWQMPCFPQITWGRLKLMTFTGKELAAERQPDSPVTANSAS